MCGIFGYVGHSTLERSRVRALVRHAEQRGRDSSGVMTHDGRDWSVQRADFAVSQLDRRLRLWESTCFFGHSRLITNGFGDNQPVAREDVYVLHNGIVVNQECAWNMLDGEPNLEIDTEVIAAVVIQHLAEGHTVEDLAARVLSVCRGVVACAVALPKLGKLVLFSNNGSLYLGAVAGGMAFSSESFPLTQIGCSNVEQVRKYRVLDIPQHDGAIEIQEWKADRRHLLPTLVSTGEQEAMLTNPKPDFLRCTRCILPDTMPYIRFDESGVCNYCLNYTPRNIPRPKEELFQLVEGYRRARGGECLVPFSGGRDSCFGLHLIVNELDMRPITYTYDWGMVTDLGRRNISRMSAELGVENIIVAADIHKKREYIAKNLRAWLRSPHLGMLSILTAGDKHFFAHVETMKKQTGIDLNLWGINPLEVTHFKAGFLGVPPDFEEDRVYSHGAMKQLRYQRLRFKAMLESPGYFNRSLWDTLSGEYHRSFTSKNDYFHIFDYWKWDEQEIEKTLDQYDWERAPDTQTTWRIGDGTAAFYNYVYYHVAGFTEHDTFRSNQVREGDLTREEALKLIEIENQPRYPNIKWYLDALGMDYASVIRTVNSIDRLYES